MHKIYIFENAFVSRNALFREWNRTKYFKYNYLYKTWAPIENLRGGSGKKWVKRLKRWVVQVKTFSESVRSQFILGHVHLKLTDEIIELKIVQIAWIYCLYCLTFLFQNPGHPCCITYIITSATTGDSIVSIDCMIKRLISNLRSNLLENYYK